MKFVHLRNKKHPGCKLQRERERERERERKRERLRERVSE